ncbi:hypothetical protein DET50_11158 [Marinobacter pelagius]|uniref:Uncharacterized protein n=1 Tax=Marinobacter pelagius TaxID=379482 RepID=A0A366GML5_9GAMM|nr:hypothetical protein DET50_11158 [Marinobacter pelagius]
MKKNRAFVNLFLADGVQKSPPERRHPKDRTSDLLYIKEITATD